MSRATILLCAAWAISEVLPDAWAACLAPLLPLYAASYLDGAEASGHRYVCGSRHETPSRPWDPFYWVNLYGWALVHEGRCPRVRCHGAARPAVGQKCIVGLHPHGIFPLGAQYSLGLGYCAADRYVALPHFGRYDEHRLMVAVASFCFYVPGMREVFLRFGFCDAGRPHVDAALGRGNSVLIFPGGAREAALTSPGGADLVLACRRGFVELALEHGASLVPAFTFGDNDLGLRARATHDLFGAAAAFKSVTGIWLPRVWPARRTCSVTTVVGSPIPVPRRGKGGWTEAEVNELHQAYVAALEELYSANVAELGGARAPRSLRLVD